MFNAWPRPVPSDQEWWQNHFVKTRWKIVNRKERKGRKEKSKHGF